MAGRSAVIFLLDDPFRDGGDEPLMLQRIRGVPALTWLAWGLYGRQVERFFLVCRPAMEQAARACFPAGAALTTASDENPSDELHVFLSTAEDEERDILVVTGPVVYCPSAAADRDGTAGACMVGREALMAALDETAPIGRFLRRAGESCGDRDGFFSLEGPWDLPRWAGPLGREKLDQLIQAGVEIWDPNNTYVSPNVQVGIGTVLMPGTVLTGDTVVGYGCTIGPNTWLQDTHVGNHARVLQSHCEGAEIENDAEVGPFANLRAGTKVGPKARAGAFVELKQTTLAECAQVPHLSYLGDAEIGAGANVGCGVVTANFDRVSKHPTTVEAEAFIGCNTTLVAPVNVGRGAYVGAGSVISEDVPAQALAIARSRQQNRRDWALRNKQKEE